jgi:hypothetical protein
MPAVNVIWQGDANARALALLQYCSTPPFVVNVTGPETVHVRRIAEQFGRIFGLPVTFTGPPATTALLSDATKAQQMFGYPDVSLGQMIEWTAVWIKMGLPLWEMPTHFATRDGRF